MRPEPAPPKMTDPRLLYIGFLGYCSGLLDNALRRRPVLITGLHRQLLYVTSFVFAGYYLLKRQDYMYAVRDHDMFGYIKLHPEDFPEKVLKVGKSKIKVLIVAVSGGNLLFIDGTFLLGPYVVEETSKLPLVTRRKLMEKFLKNSIQYVEVFERLLFRQDMFFLNFMEHLSMTIEVYVNLYVNT